jgi:hypothetical protein
MSLYDYEQAREAARRIVPDVREDAYRFSVSLPNNPTSFKEFRHEGSRYIEGRKGTEYVLKFHNRSNARVEVVFSVDGLSVVDGKPAGVGSSGYVVNPYQTLEVPGWRIDSSTVAKFVFRPQGDTEDMTYVEALRSDGVEVDTKNQGIIGCLVFKEKIKQPVYRTLGMMADYGGNEIYTKGGVRGMQMSYNSAEKPRGFAPSSASLNNVFTSNIEPESVGTGFGDDHAFKTSTVVFTRADNYTPVATHVIYYDTLKGLRRKGVPVDVVQGPSAFPASPHLNIGCRIPKKR